MGHKAPFFEELGPCYVWKLLVLLNVIIRALKKYSRHFGSNCLVWDEFIKLSWLLPYKISLANNSQVIRDIGEHSLVAFRLDLKLLADLFSKTSVYI